MISARRAALICIVALLAASFLPVQHVRAQAFAKGDVWVYSVTDTSPNMTLTGTTTTSYIGTGSVSVNGTTFRVYIIDFNTSLEGNGSGINTEFMVFDRAYYTVSTLDLLKDDYWSNLTQVNLSTGSVVTSVHTHNVTTVFPPGGYGIWPSSLSGGEAWNISYPSSSTETRTDGGASSTTSSFVNETLMYRYDGMETVTVPAGTFSCVVLNETSSEWTETLWQSDVAGSQAKIVQHTNNGETTTWILESYSYSRGASRNPLPYYAVGAGVAVVGVALVVFLLWRQRRKQSPSAEGLDSGIGIDPDVPHDPWRPHQ